MSTNTRNDSAARLGTAVVYVNRWDTSEYEVGDLSGRVSSGDAGVRVGPVFHLAKVVVLALVGIDRRVRGVVLPLDAGQ